MPERGAPSDGLAPTLRSLLGPNNVLTDPGLRAPYEVDWTRRFCGPCCLVARPASTSEVSAVLEECSRSGVPVVVQGGNTGLVGGGVPGPSDRRHAGPVLLSTRRLCEVGPVDTVASQVTAGAGATLAAVQSAAERAGLRFPVDLAARDSATVGGMVATNAGGLHVLRYGSMRSQVLGLEIVLASGAVLSRLRGLVKDNTGYDLSQLVVGSEGTLGVVTAARLRLVPAPRETVVALLGAPSTGEALQALPVIARTVPGLEAAELFFDDGLELVRAHAGLAAPLPSRWRAYLLVECAGASDQTDSLLAALLELDLPESATAVATEPAGRARLWEYRERHTEAVSALGVPHKLDVTLPPARLAEFEEQVRKVVAARAPGATLVLWGHAGDGNLHVNVVGPDAEDESVDEAVLRLVAGMDGSISAEHGIGRAKARLLHLSRSPAEMDALRALKSALDPAGLLNPGVLLEAPR